MNRRNWLTYVLWGAFLVAYVALKRQYPALRWGREKQWYVPGERQWPKRDNL
jgi:hypothetical protein